MNLLRRVQNIHWSELATKERIYENLPPISDTLMRRRLQFAGHYLRAESEVTSTLLLWSKSLPIRNRKRRIHKCFHETRVSKLVNWVRPWLMRDRAVWRAVVTDIPASDAEEMTMMMSAWFPNILHG